MKMTPKTITDRHNKFPDGTEQLIEYYANMKVVEHVQYLLKYSSVNSVPTTGTIVIVADLSIWKDFKGFSPLAGLDIHILEKITKEL